MATLGRAPAPEQQPVASPRKKTSGSRVYKIPGTNINLPRWAVHILAALTVLSSGYTSLSNPLKEVTILYQMAKREFRDTTEAYKHFSEQPVAMGVVEGLGGRLETKLFASDGCVSVTWHGTLDQDSHPHFIRMLSNGNHAPAPGKIAIDKLLNDPVNLAGAISFDGSRLMAFLSAPREEKGFDGSPGKEANGLSAAPAPPQKCLNPHPGSFKSWYGEKRDCWVQVWRQFEDGCKHYQWYNTCGGYWDANPDGSPRVYWTDCRH